MADLTVSQGVVRTLTEANPNIELSALSTRAVFNFPSDFAETSQVIVRAIEKPYTGLELSQLLVRMIYRGRNDSPKIRAWTFTLDGHDFYVLRLGTAQTLVYDTLSQEWSVYGSGEGDPWKAFIGRNWQGGSKFSVGRSNVIVGDDGAGVLYFLAPDQDVDDDSFRGEDVPRPFRRTITGQVIVKPGYNAVPCFGVHLFGSIGQTNTDRDVRLETSDDRGNTYVDAGLVTLPANEVQTRADWLSLGSMRAPGRMFRLTDTGALRRIDALEMRDGNGG